MASNWKYASLPAQERIELLKKGRKDVFEEEVERTRRVVQARRELGLDTSEQEKWMDTVGYSYNLSNAEKMGESADSVSKSGYAELYLGKSGSSSTGGSASAEGTGGSEMSQVKRYKTTTGLTSTPITSAKRKIVNAGELAKTAIAEKYAAIKEEMTEQAYSENPNLREAVLNSGGHDDGGKMARALEEIEDGLKVRLSEADAEMEREIKESTEKYARLVQELLDYRRNGTAKESLGTIADVMVKNAAIEDGFDYTLVPGVSGKVRKKAEAKPVSDGNTENVSASGTEKAAVTSSVPRADVNLKGSDTALEAAAKGYTVSEETEGGAAVASEYSSDKDSVSSDDNVLEDIIAKAAQGDVYGAVKLIMESRALDRDNAKLLLEFLMEVMPVKIAGTKQ